MTTTIYQNPFVFEKHGQSFSDYIGLCIKHFKDEKGENTQRHHILPKCMTGGVYIEERWNWVHLPKNVHKQSHLLLAESIAEHKGLARASVLMNNLSLRGFEPWNKGKTGLYKTSEETRKKQSESHTNKTLTEEHKANISKARTGNLLFSKETRQKMSQSRKGKEPWNKGIKQKDYQRNVSSNIE
jgi:hypothetical protein